MLKPFKKAGSINIQIDPVVLKSEIGRKVKSFRCLCNEETSYLISACNSSFLREYSSLCD